MAARNSARLVTVIALGAIALVIFNERANFLYQNNLWGDDRSAAIAR